MHPTLSTLFESLGPGMVWLDSAGAVRYSNHKGAAWTGLHAGALPKSGPWRAALQRMQATGRAATMRLPAAGNPEEMLSCRLLPGLNGEGAIALIEPEHTISADGGLLTLMTLLRADLAAPLNELTRGLRAAIDREETQTPAPLLALVSELQTGFERLLDLAQVFGTESLQANERIEIPPLLEQVWAAIAPLAQVRRLQIRVGGLQGGDTLAPVYGSASLLARVVIECLASVLRNAPAGSRVDVTLHQRGPRLLIVLHDCGPFAARRDELQTLDLLLPRDTGRAARVLDTLGLQLCQRIVKLHGGTLRWDASEGPHDFLIDLPTGGPGHPTDGAVSAGQIERYARDMAQLLARTQRPGAVHAAVSPPPSSPRRAGMAQP